MRYVGYVRISSEDQRGNYSLAAQRYAIESWVAKQQGNTAGTLVQVYEDECFTGLVDNRPASQRMMQDAKEDKFDAVIVHKWDRLSRSRRDAIRCKSTLRREYGIKLFAVEGVSEDEDELVGMVFEAMTEVWSELYSRNLSRETQKGKQQKAREGKHNNRALFGTDKTKAGILSANPIEQPGLLLAMESYATGKQSDNRVAQVLNAAGHVTKQGKPFTSEMVRAMLQNRTYIGEVRYQPYHTHMDGSRDKSPRIEWFKGQHEPLVPIALFDRCQEIRRLLRRRPKRQGCFQVYLLGGLIYCDYCGRRMRSQRSPCGKRYYRCGNRIVDKPCEHRMIPASVAEAQVAAMISRIANTENWRAHIAGTGTTGTQIDQRARELKQAVERLDLQWDQGFIAKDQYLARRIELQKQLEQLQPFSEPELKEAEELLEKFEKSWSVDDTIEHKRLFNRVAEKVWIRGRRVTALRLRPLFAYLAQHVSGIDVDGKGVIVAKDR